MTESHDCASGHVTESHFNRMKQIWRPTRIEIRKNVSRRIQERAELSIVHPCKEEGMAGFHQGARRAMGVTNVAWVQ